MQTETHRAFIETDGVRNFGRYAGTREFACGTSNIATRSVVSEFPRARRDHSPIHFPLIYRCSFMFSPAHVPVSARTRRSRHSGPPRRTRGAGAGRTSQNEHCINHIDHRASCGKINPCVTGRNAQDDYVQAPKCMHPNFQKVCAGEINSRECRIGIGLCTRRPRHDLHQHGKGSLLRHEVVGGPL